MRERQIQTGSGARARPTWGRGGRLVRLALDVGLDSLVLSYQEERTRKTATTDANHCKGQRGHDLAARISHHTHIQGTYYPYTRHKQGINKARPIRRHRYTRLNPPPFGHPLKRGKARYDMPAGSMTRSDDRSESQECRRSRDLNPPPFGHPL